MFFGEPDQDTMQKSFGYVHIMRETGQFELPTGKLVDTIEGHVLYSHNANAFWLKGAEEGDEETAAPDCSSTDGVFPNAGENKQAESCAECPMNEFGTAKEGKGKACKNTIRLLILLDNEYVPVILPCPPTSIGKKSSLMKWISSTVNEVGKAYTEFNPKIKTKKGAPITERYLAHVKLSLNKERYSGKVVSVVQAETTGVLLPNAEGLTRLRYINSVKDDAIKAYKEEISSRADNKEDIPF